MKHTDFISAAIMSLDQEYFETIKKALVGEYLSFSIISDEDISKAVLAEKLCDYFEKLELKTGKDFDKQVDAYIKEQSNFFRGCGLIIGYIRVNLNTEVTFWCSVSSHFSARIAGQNVLCGLKKYHFILLKNNPFRRIYLSASTGRQESMVAPHCHSAKIPSAEKRLKKIWYKSKTPCGIFPWYVVK